MSSLSYEEDDLSIPGGRCPLYPMRETTSLSREKYALSKSYVFYTYRARPPWTVIHLLLGCMGHGADRLRIEPETGHQQSLGVNRTRDLSSTAQRVTTELCRTPTSSYAAPPPHSATPHPPRRRCPLYPMGKVTSLAHEVDALFILWGR
jgi:hypothetical protein